jgi:hypothetical protein
MHRKPSMVIRVLGVALGVLLAVVGVCALIYFNEVGMLQRIAGGVAMIGTGVYFLNYGITGRRYLLGRPPI